MATLVQSGVAPNCLLSPTHDLWVINFGASDHMTGSSTLSDCHLSNSYVSLAKVVGVGNTLSVDIKLVYVLYVLSIPFNLLSIMKITKTLPCCIRFYPSLCIFQDLDDWYGARSWCLYYVDFSHIFLPRALQPQYLSFYGIVVPVILLF